MSALGLHLMLHEGVIGIARLPAGQEPTWDWRTGCLSSVTYTGTETSVVCAFEAVPEGITVQGPLAGFEIAGPLDFSMVGILSGLLDPLARKGISVLAVSTYDTDWILIEADRAQDAALVWRRHGHTVTRADLSKGLST